MILLLTDGEQSSSFGGDNAAITTAGTVKDSGITLMAVGFGGSDSRTLDSVASSPSSTYSYRGSSLSDVQQHLTNMCTIVASPRPPPAAVWPAAGDPHEGTELSAAQRLQSHQLQRDDGRHDC